MKQTHLFFYNIVYIFQPAVPLPDEIKIITGEEDEDVLYVHRAKLFRLDKATKEWKERGVGDIKILRHKVNGKVRFLMRREIVQKLCMNHYLTQDIKMELQNEKNWVWYAVDYSDGNAAVEIFTLRFKTPDIAKEFKAAVDKALVS
ncbi:hypothetical protein AAG570_000501 [Ranatra chinensis]|uniref:RanBD1 domain-containing protein n=1 Tax=Ranatra chinensis TaxID=642074 RepID=A0ABD0YXY1_9HEMI